MTPACQRLEDAAVYVLGAMSETDARAYAAHLNACSTCAGRVAELEPVAGCLAVAVPQHQPPAQLRDRLMREVRAEADLLQAAGPSADRPERAPRRRTRRWRLSLSPLPAAALSCALLALGVGGGVLAFDDDGSSGRLKDIPANVAAPGAPAAKAVLRVAPTGAKLIVAGMPAPPQGRIYQVWLDHSDDDAPAEPTDVLFSVSKTGRATVDVPGDLRDVSAVLVTDEPDGGSSEPSSRPVIMAQPS